MQKFTVGDGGNPDGTAKDRVGLTAGTTLKAKYWNDNVFNLLEAVTNAGYTLIDNDISQLHKAIKGLYVATYTYNTAAIATQSVNDVVLGSDGYYYEVQNDAVTGDDPVGSVTGNWVQVKYDLGSDVAFQTNLATAKTSFVSADRFGFWDSVSGALRHITGANLIASISSSITTSISGVRQTVQSGSVDTSGFANFVSIGTGLAVNIAATTVPLKIHAAGGAVENDRIGTVSADTSITGLTASATNYLYADVASNGVVTLSANVVAHLEQFGGTPAVTNNLTTFNYSGMTGYTGNSATAPQSWRVPIGEAVTNATNVTSVVTYALNGMYKSGYIATLPALTDAVSKFHNIGTDIIECSIVAKCTTIDVGFAVGDIFENISTVGGGAYPLQLNIVRTNKAMSFKTGDSGTGWQVTNKSTGVLANVTRTSWSYELMAKRGF